MVLRKITIDKSVSYIPQSEQTKKNIKPKTTKPSSLPGKKRQKLFSK